MTTSLSKDISNTINNDITDNKTTLNEPKILEILPLKNASKIEQLKDDRKYISSNNVDKLQDNFIKIVEYETKDGVYYMNVLSLENGGGLLVYNLIWYLMSSCLLTVPSFLRLIPIFLCQYLSSVLFFTSSPMFEPPGSVFIRRPYVMQARCEIKKRG